jgi:hypothetical protein
MEESLEYTDEFRQELDHRYDYYINGGKMISAEDADKQIKELVMKIKNR